MIGSNSTTITTGEALTRESTPGGENILHTDPGLESLSQSRIDAVDSSESFAYPRYAVPPSTIIEEEVGEENSIFHASPFDTPVVNDRRKQEEHRKSGLSFSTSYNSLLSPPTGTTLMNRKPTHPDLVPAPLNLMKHNSVRDEGMRERALDLSEGIDKDLLRRSLTSPPSPKKELHSLTSRSDNPGVVDADVGEVGEECGKSLYHKMLSYCPRQLANVPCPEIDRPDEPQHCSAHAGTDS